MRRRRWQSDTHRIAAKADETVQYLNREKAMREMKFVRVLNTLLIKYLVAFNKFSRLHGCLSGRASIASKRFEPDSPLSSFSFGIERWKYTIEI